MIRMRALPLSLATLFLSAGCAGDRGQASAGMGGVSGLTAGGTGLTT